MPSIPSPLPTLSTLTPATLSALLALYDPTLAHLAATKRAPKSPSAAPSLPALDHLRYTTIPARIRARRADASSSSTTSPAQPPEDDHTHGWLEKDELETLVAWKLTRGHPRPALLGLIRSNAPALVRDTTARAYALFAADTTDPFPALKVLAQLRGVGPATASLLLAVGWPGEVPFFADELLGWVRGDGGRGRVRYDWREYGEVWEGVRGVRGRVGVGAEEVERGAWVLGRVGVEGMSILGVGDGDGDGNEEVVVGQAGGAGEAGGEEEMEKGKGKRKAGGEIKDVERSLKVPRRRKMEPLEEEKAADGSVPRRSSRNKH